MKKLSLVILLVCAVAAGFAQTHFTATYTFGNNGNVTSFTYNGTPVTNLTMGPIVKAGVTSVASNDNFRASDWPTVNAPDPNKYIGFTMTVADGYVLTVKSIDFGIGRDANGTLLTQWRGSHDNYGSILYKYEPMNSGLSIQQGHQGVLQNLDQANSWTGNTLMVNHAENPDQNDLDPYAPYDRITGTCGFRMYMYDADAASGTAGLDGNITITGTIYPQNYISTFVVSPTEITDFSYEADQTEPSETKYVTITGTNMAPGKIQVQVHDPYEVYDGNSWVNDETILEIDVAGGDISETIPVRVRARKPANNEDGSLTSYMTISFINYDAGIQTEEAVVFLSTGTDPTLPVTLSHFSATLTAENFVQLTWISQTETNLVGYNVLRSAEDNLSTASQICAMIPATNTSQAQTYVYVDQGLVEDGTYYYWLQNVEMDGTSGYHGPVSVVFSINGYTGSPAIPTATQLDNAYPNPFNPHTTIRYQLESPGRVKIDIYNTKGQIVRSFEQNHAAAGNYNLLWDGCDDSGNTLASGVYLYKMTSGKYSGVKKMVLHK